MSQWEPAGISLTGPATGDLAGTYPSPLVDGLQNRPVAGTQPNSGQVLGWDGNSWTPVNMTAGGAASGDLSGNYPGPIVDGLQNRPVANTQPNGGQFLGWNSSSNQWEPTTDNNYPAGPAGGDLTGTYPDPQIAADAVTSAEILNSTITADDIGSNAVGMAEINHDQTMGSFSADHRTVDDGGGQYIMSNESFTPPVDGKCLVIVDAVISTGGSANSEPRPYIKTARRSGGTNEADEWSGRYFPSNVDSDKDTAVTASHLWDVSAGVTTTFGCYAYNRDGDWSDDEYVYCRVSYVCN